MIGKSSETKFKMFADGVGCRDIDRQMNEWAAEYPDNLIIDVKFSMAWDGDNKMYLSQAIVIYKEGANQ